MAVSWGAVTGAQLPGPPELLGEATRSDDGERDLWEAAA